MAACKWQSDARCLLAEHIVGSQVVCPAGACDVCQKRHPKTPTIDRPGSIVASLVVRADASQIGRMTPHIRMEKPPKRDKRTVAMLPCTHRGEVIRSDTSNLCGTRGESVNVFACDLHGECSLGRYCQHQTVRSCATCGDRSEYPPGN